MTVLNNGTTSTVEIDIHILAVMHTDLPRSHNDDTILNSGYMRSTSNMPSNDERPLNILQSKSGKGGIICSWNRHVDNTPVEFSQRAGGCCSRRRGRENDVEADVTRNVDICCL